jgi:ferric-dicitrate binding protein FerR (iron transport regulator)
MQFFEHRFSPELREKFEPWRAKNPGNLRALKMDRNAPRSFPRPTHREGIAARALQRAAEAEFAQGEDANRISDRYVAATVVLSTVLFLGGISPLLNSARIRMALLGLATLLGIAASLFIFRLPIDGL